MFDWRDDYAYYLFLEIGLLPLKLGLWGSAWRKIIQKFLIQKSVHTPSTVSSQRSARKPKTWEPLLWLFLLLNLLSDGRSAGSRGILKERLLTSLNRKDDLHVLFSYSILLIIFNILFAEAIFHLLFRKRKRFLETPLCH